MRHLFPLLTLLVVQLAVAEQSSDSDMPTWLAEHHNRNAVRGISDYRLAQNTVGDHQIEDVIEVSTDGAAAVVEAAVDCDGEIPQPTMSSGTSTIVISFDPSQSGKFLLQIVVDQGKATVAPLTIDYELTNPTPPPVPDLTERSKLIKAASLAVVGDSAREETARILATTYREIKDQVDSGAVTGEDKIANLARLSVDLLLRQRGVEKVWAPVRAVFSNQWAAVQQEGGKDADYSKLLGEVADGLAASVSPRQADPVTLEVVKSTVNWFVKNFELTGAK